MHIFPYQEQMDGQYIVYGSLIVFFTSLTVSLVVKMWCCEYERHEHENPLVMLPDTAVN
jgi:hypothetical protein